MITTPSRQHTPRIINIIWQKIYLGFMGSAIDLSRNIPEPYIRSSIRVYSRLNTWPVLKDAQTKDRPVERHDNLKCRTKYRTPQPHIEYINLTQYMCPSFILRYSAAVFYSKWLHIVCSEFCAYVTYARARDTFGDICTTLVCSGNM